MSETYYLELYQLLLSIWKNLISPSTSSTDSASFALKLTWSPLPLTSTKTIFPGLVNSLTYMYVLRIQIVSEYTNMHIIDEMMCGKHIDSHH